MRYDDMLATVLALAADRPDRQAARWRQLRANLHAAYYYPSQEIRRILDYYRAAVMSPALKPRHYGCIATRRFLF